MIQLEFDYEHYFCNITLCISIDIQFYSLYRLAKNVVWTGSIITVNLMFTFRGIYHNRALQLINDCTEFDNYIYKLSVVNHFDCLCTPKVHLSCMNKYVYNYYYNSNSIIV